MLWFQAISRSINRHGVNRSGLNFFPGRRGWTQEQLQKPKALSEAAAKLPWAVGPEKEISSQLRRLHALPKPRRRLARGRGSCRRGLPGSPGGSRARVRGAEPGGGSRWVGGAVGALRLNGCAPPAAGAQPKELWAHLNRSSACHFSVVRWITERNGKIYLLMVLVMPCFSFS